MASAPRLFRSELTKRWARGWSPHELLACEKSFPPKSAPLTLKRSQKSRFFMYEEHANQRVKIQDSIGSTEVLQGSPSELADFLSSNDKNCYHYWTAPVADVAPGLLERLQGYESLYDQDDQRLLDPRGPSLWMGNSGSGTQAHYDVANNVIVQLHGSKRVRCYPPRAAKSLHVFPDAHPRARKSQVNFDEPDHEHFPHFSSLQPPVLDVILRPGDALRIPAFWFHHVENGRIPPDDPHNNKDADIGEDGPSVSLNVFALSLPIMTAQRIFMNASRPFGNLATAPGINVSTDQTAANEHYEFSLAALRALGRTLLEGLDVQGPPEDFIRTFLLESRYAPLRNNIAVENNSENSREERNCSRKLTDSEQDAVVACVARVLPEFEYLKARGGEEKDIDGIVHLVALHLLELWAVELVGAKSVAGAWDDALPVKD